MSLTKAALTVALFALAEGLRMNRMSCGRKGSRGRNGTGIAIVNGDDSYRCEWKWQAALVSKSNPTFLCGGSLIDSQWVLSAAHCMDNTDFDVVLGAYNMTWTSESSRQTFSAAAVYKHPQWDADTTNFDFALVKLEIPAELGDCVGTVCLPDSDVAAGTDCWITGWGTLSAGGRKPNTHQEGQVQIISNEDCTSKFDYGPRQITDQMMCAQGNSNGKIVDACQGDSGGPLVCKEKKGGAWTVYGATSFGRGCADARYPGVWARVSAQLEWIDNTMNG